MNKDLAKLTRIAANMQASMPLEAFELYQNAIRRFANSKNVANDLKVLNSQMTTEMVDAQIQAANKAWESGTILASQLAFIRMLPLDKATESPARGMKAALKDIPKKDIPDIITDDGLAYDTKDREYYSIDNPDDRVSRDGAKVIASGVSLFRKFKNTQLVELTEKLCNGTLAAMEDPVGKEIHDIIMDWDNFIDFKVEHLCQTNRRRTREIY